jgi:hypothetical protein
MKGKMSFAKKLVLARGGAANGFLGNCKSSF